MLRRAVSSASSATMTLTRGPMVTPLRFATMSSGTAAAGAFVLPDLPFDKNAFGKNLSSEQINVHWDKHHRNYYNQLNNIIKDQPENVQKMTLEEVVLHAVKTNNKSMFNNAAQALNHNVFWECLTPSGGGKDVLTKEKCPKLVELMERDLGGVQNAISSFEKEAKTHFASGWAWFVLTKDGKLAVKSYHDADTPIAHGDIPILTVDVWEHAYYIDFQNRRADFVETFTNKIANYQAAEKKLVKALNK